VLGWLAEQEPLSVYLTTITQAEAPFDEDAARLFPKTIAGRSALGRPIAQFDAMIAAIARSRQAALATRNPSDFAHCGLRLINPWI
jgi:hypothetical protein